jgi:hypothetical protein
LTSLPATERVVVDTVVPNELMMRATGEAVMLAGSTVAPALTFAEYVTEALALTGFGAIVTALTAGGTVVAGVIPPLGPDSLPKLLAAVTNQVKLLPFATVASMKLYDAAPVAVTVPTTLAVPNAAAAPFAL